MAEFKPKQSSLDRRKYREYEKYSALLPPTKKKEFEEAQKDKPNWFQKIISVLSTGETGNAAYSLLEGKNPVEQYGKDVIRSIKGQGYDRRTYADVLERLGMERTYLSEKVPWLYSATGKGLQLKEKGFLDPTDTGSLGLTLDILGDPLTYAGGAGIFMRIGKAGKYLTKPGREIFNEATKRAEKHLARRKIAENSPEAVRFMNEISDDIGRRLKKDPDRYFKGVTFMGQQVIPRKLATAPGRLTDTLMGHIPIANKVYAGAKMGVQDLFKYGGDVLRQGKELGDAGELTAERYIKSKDMMFKEARYATDQLFNSLTDLNKLFKKGTVKADREEVNRYLLDTVEKNFKNLGIDSSKIDNNLAEQLRDSFQKYNDGFYGAEAAAKQSLENDVYEKLSGYMQHILTKEAKEALAAKNVANFRMKGWLSWLTKAEKSRNLYKFVDEKGNTKFGTVKANNLREYNSLAEVNYILEATAKVLKNKQVNQRRINDLITELRKQQPTKRNLNKIATREKWVKQYQNDINKAIDKAQKKVSDLPDVKKYFKDSDGNTWKVERTMTINEINDMMADFMKASGKEGKKFLANDPFEILFARGQESFKKIAMLNHFKRISALGKTGDEVVEYVRSPKSRKTTVRKYYADKIDEATGIRYVDPKIPEMPEGVLLPDYIVGDIKKSIDLLDDKEVVSKILQAYDKLMTFWKGTVYGWYPASHGRNFIGGSFNNFLANPKWVKFLDRAKPIVTAKKGSVTLNGKKFSYDLIQKEIGKSGILGQTGILDVNELTKAFNPSVAKRIQYFPVKAMDATESGLRVPLFLAEIDDGKSFAEAAKTVFKYHFDYSPEGLSTFERKVMKRFIPFYCVPDTSLILTKEGWKDIDSLNKGDIALTYNKDKDELEWQPVKEKAVFDYDEPIRTWQNKRHKLTFTHNHRWVVEKKERKTKHSYGEYNYKAIREIKPSTELNSIHYIRTSAKYKGEKSLLSSEKSRLLGWLLTDGYFRWKGNYCEAVIYQHPKKYLDEVKEVAGGKPRKPHPDTGVVCVPVLKEKIEPLKKYLKRNKGKDSWIDIVTSLSEEALISMYDAMMKGDGHYGKKQTSFACQLDGVAKTFEVLATLLGKRVVRNDRGFYVSDIQTLGIKDGEFSEEEYFGRVWCPKTDNETWVMKQGKLITITGNTWNRRNIPLMMEEFISQPGKMTGLFKMLRNASDKEGNLMQEYLPSYMQEQETITRGGQTMTGFGLPPIEMFKYLSKPQKSLTAGLTPIVKVPVELKTNYNTFKDRVISEDTSGYFARDYPKVVKDWLEFEDLSYERGDEKIENYYVDPMKKYYLYAFPTGRLASILSRQLDDEQKNKILDALTNIRTYEYDMQELKERAEYEYEKELLEILESAKIYSKFGTPYKTTKERLKEFESR